MKTIADIRDISRIRLFLEEIDEPITQTELGKATGTQNVIKSALRFMLKINWVEVLEERTPLYYLNKE